MLARCLQDVWKLSSMSLKDLLIFFVSVWVGIWRVAVKSEGVLRVFIGYLERVLKVFGVGLEGVLKVSGRGLEGSERCLDRSVWKVSGRCLCVSIKCLEAN